MIELADESAKVMVVDDDYIRQEVLKFRLREFGFKKVVAFEDSEEASLELVKDKVSREEPSVAGMFINYHLSLYTGDHLALEARRIRPDLPICIVSYPYFYQQQLGFFDYHKFYLLTEDGAQLGLVLSMMLQREHRPFNTYYP